MDLLYNKKLNYGYTEVIGEEVQELDYVTLGILRLKEGESFSRETGNYEIALVILGGSCSIETDNQTWSNLGKRLNVFQGKSTSVYIPCNSSYKVTAESEVEIAVCGARAEKKTLPQLITPDDVVVNHLGKLNWRRDVHDIISLDNTDAHRIIIGETFNRPGCWSSYPPHRHDYNNLPEEVDLEEVYHFRVLPKQGFGIQRIYKEDQSLNEAYAVTDESTVIIPEGYHPVAAAPGYQLYYLWILAGETRIMRPRDNPDHKWLRAVEEMVD